MKGILKRIGKRPGRNSALLLVFFLALWSGLNGAYWQRGIHPAPFFAPRAPGGVLSFLGRVDSRFTSPDEGQIPPLVANRALVSEVQGLLAGKGFYHGVVDGVDSPAARQAIAEYERSLGLAPTGEPSQQLLSRMRLDEIIARDETMKEAAPLPVSAPAPSPSTPQARPLSDEKVRILKVQRALNRFGYGPVSQDGMLGHNTREAIRRFQVSQGLKSTGRLDDALMVRLIAIGALE